LINQQQLQQLKSHRSWRLLIIFFLGVASGLPFLLILSTLNVWLTESGISKTDIGLLAAATLPYSLKFFMAPYIDYCRIPYLTQKFGPRRSWMLIAQCILIFALIRLGSTQPELDLRLTVFWACIVGIAAAMQDVVIEAYRLELLPTDEIAFGASASAIGYRMGLLLSGGGAIYLAVFMPWRQVYLAMASCMLIGILATLLAPKIKLKVAKVPRKIGSKSHYRDFFLLPITTMLQKKEWFIMLPFILSFKSADAVINSMSMPFLLELGFSKPDIANVAKTFGIFATVCGSVLGGSLLGRNNLRYCLLLFASLQLIACTLFIVQSKIGQNIYFLFVTMGVEHVVSGASHVALIAYLSSFCRRPYTASHYALLSSYSSLVRVLLAICSGFLADSLAWWQFYTVVAFGCLPSLLFLTLFPGHFLGERNGVN